MLRSLLLVFCLAGAGAFLFLESMTSPLNHDEDHYLAGAVMAKDHVIYRDFTYSAMPLHPVLMGGLLRVLPTERPFLLFRVLSAGIVWGGVLLLFLLLRAILRHDGEALLFSSFFAFNTLLLYSTNGLISCHIPAITLSIAAAGALRLAFVRRSSVWSAVAGFCFCLAAGFKLYYLLLLLLAPVLLLLVATAHGSPAGEMPQREGRRRLRWRLFFAFLAGTLPAGVPVLIIFFRDPYPFLFNNYFFHQYNTAWRIAIGELGRISLLSRIGYVIEKLGFTGNGAIALMLIAAAVGLRARGLRSVLLRSEPMALFWLMLAVLATLGAMLPRPMHLHYLTFPLPFYLLLAATLFAQLEGRARRRAAYLLYACAAIVVVSGGRFLFQEGLRGLAPSGWIPNVVHAQARQITEALSDYPEPRLVSTLSPLHVIEAGLPFDPAFAGSAFFFRVGDIIPPEVQQQLGLVQQGHALEHLEKLMPAAVLTGFEDTHEAEFLEFVNRHGYQRYSRPIYTDGVLYLPPLEKAPPP